uniref:disks large-associated protein 5 n=1 Tax=Euleptes europaea TaxID=460621 RepID=UPI002541CCEB|nr:disks large-associated protein 5 [Euleptes europaea]
MSKSATNFASRYKKDLSIEALKAKLVHRKSVSQKESRHKHFDKGRQFGLADVNTQHARDKELSRLEETGEGRSPEKSKGKPKQIPDAKICGKERREMLQRYKAEKELRKLKEQREKPIFKCGRYKPEMPSFLPQPSQIPVLSKPKEKAVAPPVRVTRSKAKSVLEETAKPPPRLQASTVLPKCTSKGSGLQPPQCRQQHIYVDKPAKKESKGAQPAVPPNPSGRMTRATAAAMSKLPQVLKPAVTAGNLAEKRVTHKGKRQMENKNKEALHDVKEDDPTEPIEEGAAFQLAATEDAQEAEASPEKENVPAPEAPVLPPRRMHSFAPQNFVFKPLEGLASFKVSPMTPSRASVFLCPSLTWNPTKTTSEVPMEDAKETAPQDSCSESEPSPVPEATKEDLPESPPALEPQEDKMEPGLKEKTMAVTSETEIDQRLTDLPAPETSELMGEPQHDVPYFRNILHSETERLTSRCLEWDGTAEMDIPEEAKDLVRTTVGQTRLLIAERFRQFQGLVDNCEFRRGEKETMCSDLDGFWDMVAFQVEDVNKKFEDLRKLQENGWQMVDNDQTKRITKKKTAPQRATRATGRSVGKTAARKRLAAIKAMMKNKTKPEGVVARQEMPKEEEEKITFDGGFFRVESPARSFPGQTPKSASRSSQRASRQATPRSISRAFLQSCADTCVARLGTPAAARSCPPLPDLDASAGPSQTDLLGRISDQSDVEAAVGTDAAADRVVEETDESRTASAVGTSPHSSDVEDVVSMDSQEAESPGCKQEASNFIEEVPQVATDLGDEGVVRSPEKEALFEGPSSQGEEQHTPACQTGRLLGDFSCDDGTSEGQPNLDCSLFFTPLKNEAQTLAAAASNNDLIVFSPLPFPAGEK